MDTLAEINELTMKFAKAVAERDFAALGTFYEERGRFLPPGGPMVEGLAAIQAAIKKMVEAGIEALHLEAVHIIEGSDFIIEIGRTTVTIKPPGVMSLILLLVGKRRLVKRRQKDGVLKIVVDTFNGHE